MKTYEEMAQSALKRIDEQKESQKKRKKAVIRIAASAIGFCFAAAIGFAIWRSGTGKGILQQNADGVIAPGIREIVKNSIENASGGNAEKRGQSSFVMIPDNGKVPAIEIPEMISSYPSGEEDSYDIPENGQVAMSSSLQNAIEEYKETVKYRVVIDIYKGTERINDKKRIEKEVDRLNAVLNSSVICIEEYNDGTETTRYFTLHATAEELLNFVPDQSTVISFLCMMKKWNEFYL